MLTIKFFGPSDIQSRQTASISEINLQLKKNNQQQKKKLRLN